MRTWFSSSMDYNQMLVVSVVLHLLAIVVIMFLPKPKIMQKRIIPSFNFEVIEIPFQRIGEPKEPKAETVKPRVEPPPSEETEGKEALRKLGADRMIPTTDEDYAAMYALSRKTRFPLGGDE